MASAAADDAILSRFISKRVNSKGLIDPPPPRDLAKKRKKELRVMIVSLETPKL